MLEDVGAIDRSHRMPGFADDETESDAFAAIALGLAKYRQGDIATALQSFGQAFKARMLLPDDQVAAVMIDVASCLIGSFKADNQSPAAYGFLRQVCAEAAEVIAGFLLIANFPTGNEDPSTLGEPQILSCAGALSAAGRHEEALNILEELVLKRPSHLAFNHAIFVARRKQAGRSDDLTGRFCPVPFERFDVLPNGGTHICCAAFMPVNVGNLFFQDWHDVWNSKTAQAVRESIHDGSYRFCDKLKCPKFENGLVDIATLEETQETNAPVISPAVSDSDEPADHFLTPTEMKEYAVNRSRLLSEGPRMVNLSFDRSCNLACPSCRQDFNVAKAEERDRMLALAENRVLPMLEQAKIVVITGSGDPFASKAFRHIMRSLTPERFPNLQLKIMTNAVLFTPAEWEKISHLHGRIHSVVVSIDAAEPETYSVLRRGGDWNRLMENLMFLGGLHREGAFSQFGLAFVVQAENWREMPDFVNLGKRVGASVVRFSPIENWGTYAAPDYAQQAVQFESHSEHEAFKQLLRRPELDDPCVRLGVLDRLRDPLTA